MILLKLTSINRVVKRRKAGIMQWNQLNFYSHFNLMQVQTEEPGRKKIMVSNHQFPKYSLISLLSLFLQLKGITFSSSDFCQWIQIILVPQNISENKSTVQQNLSPNESRNYLPIHYRSLLINSDKCVFMIIHCNSHSSNH